MKYAKLGNTGLDVSRIALDCCALGATQYERGWDPASYHGEVFAIRTLHAALDAGINLFDTRPDIDGGRGEALLGKALAGRQESALLTSRLGRVENEAAIETGVLGTLRRLRAEHLDIIYVDDQVGQEESTLALLARLRERGVVRFLGLAVASLRRANPLADSGVFDVVLMDGELNGDQYMARRVHECADRGMGVGISNPEAAYAPPPLASVLPAELVNGGAFSESALKRLLCDSRFDFLSLDMRWEHEVLTSSRMVADIEPAFIPLALTC